MKTFLINAINISKAAFYFFRIMFHMGQRNFARRLGAKQLRNVSKDDKNEELIVK